MFDAEDPVNQRAQSRVGSTLKEKWTLDKLLGLGGMAAVYAATHRNGKRVAIKVLHVELSVDPEIRGRFLREGYLANKVEHPGAVSVLDDESADDGSVFLVMELLEGESLARHFERREKLLTAESVLIIVDQVLDVLATAHAKQIIHRDIKPDNIFLTRDGQVKVLDFGIARLRELSTGSLATRSGSTMGTPAYMPPEQARGRWDEVDARADLWAVGATMFKLLTGNVVHQADTVNEQLLAAMTKTAQPIGGLVPGLACPVVEIVDRALAYEKEQRWADARAMQQAVRDAYQASAGTPMPSIMRPSMVDAGEAGVALADTVSKSSTTAPTAPAVERTSQNLAQGERAPVARSRRGPRVIPLIFLGAAAGATYLALRSGEPLIARTRHAVHSGAAGAHSATGSPQDPAATNLSTGVSPDEKSSEAVRNDAADSLGDVPGKDDVAETDESRAPASADAGTIVASSPVASARRPDTHAPTSAAHAAAPPPTKPSTVHKEPAVKVHLSRPARRHF